MRWNRRPRRWRHYLASTGVPKNERPQPKAVAAGKASYHQLGCVACHGTRDADGNQDKIIATSVPLGDLKAKYTLASLSAFWRTRTPFAPRAACPNLLDSKEAKDVASYLLQGLGMDLAGANMKFGYYEGDWTNLPDFDKLKAEDHGHGARRSTSTSPCGPATWP